MMQYKSKDKVKILEYKFVFEEAAQVKKEYEEGTADLNYRLSFFREKLNAQKATPEEKDSYDRMFMGNIPNDNKAVIIPIESGQRELTQSALKASTDIKPWAKKQAKEVRI